MNYYDAKGQNTRIRRRAAGKYETKEHKAAMSKLLQRNGEASLTAAECLTLSTYPHFPMSQRNKFRELAQERE